MRACEGCGKALPRGAHPRKRFHDDKCRKRGARAATVTVIHGAAEPEEEGFAVAAATRTALADAGRLESPLGAAAMVLARRLDFGGDTGSAVAALTREHRAALEAALAGGDAKADTIDELRKWREDRQRRALG